MNSPKGATFRAMYTVKDGIENRALELAFNEFAQHLVDAGFAETYRIARHQPFDGEFGVPLFDFTHYSEINFPDAALEEACYGYVKARPEPCHSLHVAMNRLVKKGSARFFVTINL
jgi:hypothetical protein